jgi:hypothetical protein
MADKSTNHPTTDVESGVADVPSLSPDHEHHAPTTHEKPSEEDPCAADSNEDKRGSTIHSIIPPTLALYKPTKAPKETLKAVYKAAEYKAGLPLNLLVLQRYCFFVLNIFNIILSSPYQQ